MAYWLQQQDGLWDPFRELQDEMNRLVFGAGSTTAGFNPGVNVWATDRDVLLEVLAPGVDAEQIDLQVKGDRVAIELSRTADQTEDNVTRHRTERGSGEFSRSVQLPFEVDADKVEATYRRGVLQIRLPRHEQSLPRKVNVQIG